jgi:amino acid transporter
MSEPLSAPHEPALRAAGLTTSKIVFLVIAAAAPLAAMVGTVPLAFAIGTGAGFPVMFVFTGLTLLCFSVGYAAMSRRIVDAGGFYTYLAAGLGRSVAVAGGFVAVIAYTSMSIGLAAAFGYFAHLIGSAHGLSLPWQVWTGIAVVATGALAWRRIDLNARVLSVLMIVEIGILAVFDAAVLVQEGGSALPTVVFHPHTVFSGAVGVSLMFAFISYIGFESAALYGEEATNPRRSVPVATYVSVIVITVFYGLTSWIAVGAVGAEHVRERATSELGNLFFTLSDQYLSANATTLLQILLCTSLFAALLALHNAGNRYLFALGRDRVIPSWFGVVNPRHGSMNRASAVQSVVTVVVVAAAALSGLNPYTGLAVALLGLGTLGIIVLQAGAALAVPAFFRSREGRHWWRTGLAPVLGLIGLTTAAVLLVANFDVMTGSSSTVINALPWLLVVAASAGLVRAGWMRANRPQAWRGLVVDLREPPRVPVPVGAAAAAESLPRT